MGNDVEERDEVWWLASGTRSRSRQPSFAPTSARSAVSFSYFRFGWNRKKNCFVTTARHDIIALTHMQEYPCDPEVALQILRRCAYKGVSIRFFGKLYGKSDAEIFAAAGYMFGISLTGENDYSYAEASLHFYSPKGIKQTIRLNYGMTSSFRRLITGMRIADIRRHMQ